MCVVFYPRLFVYLRMPYANVNFKTTLRECPRAGLPLDFHSTAPPPVRVSAVLGTLAVLIPNPPKKDSVLVSVSESEEEKDNFFFQN